MALDRSGTLYLFEMKRWKSDEENLLQVLRYGQRYGRYDYDRLNNLFQSYLHTKGTADRKLLRDAHQEYFELSESLEPSKINEHQRFVIITNGLDRPTREAIEYWKKYQLPVEALVYRVYQETGSGALMIDFDPYGPLSDISEATDEGLFVVNTNITYEPQAYRDMLDKSKASAYGSRKYLIGNIHKGARVCLYHTGVGVVAIGRVKSECMKCPFDGEADYEYYVKCDFDHKFDPVQQRDMAVSASEINQHFNTGHCFRQTVFTLPIEYDVFIRERFSSKLVEQQEHLTACSETH